MPLKMGYSNRKARKMNQGGMCYSQGGEIMDGPSILNRPRILKELFRTKMMSMGGPVEEEELHDEDMDLSDDYPMEMDLQEEPVESEDPQDKRRKMISRLMMSKSMRR